MDQLPIPSTPNWQALYEPGARARCIKANPPMYGFGRALAVGDVVDVESVCWRGKYEISVASECAFYALEGWFEVVEKLSTTNGDPSHCPDAQCASHGIID